MSTEGPTVAAGPSELRLRIISAAVLAPVPIAAVILGGLPFAVMVAAVAALALWEWTGMAAAGAMPMARLVLVAGMIAGLLLVDAAPVWALVMLGATLLLGLVMGAPRRSHWTGLGVVYIAFPCAGLILLRQAQPFGWAAVLFILALVWATDIAAYFGGRALGGAKLWPRVSPKKTWSGAFTGLAVAGIVGALVAWSTGVASAAAGFALALPLSAAAQAGDLLESAVKRRFGVKDSGQIIPGHGGVLDRIDGVLGAAALAWLIAALGLGGNLLAMPGAGAAAGGGL